MVIVGTVDLVEFPLSLGGIWWSTLALHLGELLCVMATGITHLCSAPLFQIGLF